MSPRRSWWRSRSVKASQVAGGVDSVVDGMTPVAVRIHQAAKTETGMTRRSGTGAAGAAACARPQADEAVGPAAPGPSPGPVRGGAGGVASCVMARRLTTGALPPCATALLNGRSKMPLTLRCDEISPSFWNVLASFCW